MPKGQAPKLHGAIANVPVDANKTYSLLSNTETIIMVKLKKIKNKKNKVLRLCLFFELVRPEKICGVLTYLQYNNPLCSDVQIDDDNIVKLLVTDCTKETPIAIDGVHESNGSKVNDSSVEDEEEIANPLQNYQQQERESLAVINNINEVASGEGLLTKKNLFDQNWEELAFPQFFSKCRFGYSAEREIKLSPSKYFSQRLLSYKQSFASNSDYILLVQSVLQEKIFRDQISIAMKKSG